MNVSLTGSALNVLTSSQSKVTNAASEIASMSIQSDEVGSRNFNNTDLIKPVMSLHETELQNSAGVKLLQAENETLGALLNVKA